MIKYDKKNKRWVVHVPLGSYEPKFREIHEWCWKTFGHPGTDPDTGVYSHWDYHGGFFYLYNEETVNWFKLKWL